MSTPREPFPALLILSVLTAEWEDVREELSQKLEAEFGPVKYCSPALPFHDTNYYDSELGTPLSRHLLAFETLIPQDELAEAKLFTNELEVEYSREDGTRRINLDPGMITLERLVLATGKNFTHRIYLKKGIYADLTLIYQGGGWKTHPWTFPDYAGETLGAILLALREGYKEIVLAPSSQNTQNDTPSGGAL